MKKLALIAVASLFAATGAVAPAVASLSVTEATVLQKADPLQVAARGDRGGRNEGGRNARDGKRGDRNGRVIWRAREKNARPFFLFRGRGDCRTETIKRRDGSVGPAWVCN
ncbi:hypothetical protein [Rhizobium sp.]